MRVYLDNCMFNRPYDDQGQILILLESEAKLKIQEGIRAGVYELVWSYILDYENSKNPCIERREHIAQWRHYAQRDMVASELVITQAKRLQALGLKTFDALHIACAIAAQAQYFLTTDKGVLKKADQITEIQIQDPIGFIREVIA